MPRSSSTDDLAAEVRYALNAFPEIQEIFHIQQSVAGTRNYFRPRVVWRVVRKAIFNLGERRRLQRKRANTCLCVRSGKRFVREQRKDAAGMANKAETIPSLD